MEMPKKLRESISRLQLLVTISKIHFETMFPCDNLCLQYVRNKKAMLELF